VTAQGPTVVGTLLVCVVFSAVVGRWWALLLPAVLGIGVLALAQIDWYYARVPEDIQAGVFTGAMSGLLAAIGAVTLRQRLRRGRGGNR
jgi:hypothetical protein